MFIICCFNVDNVLGEINVKSLSYFSTKDYLFYVNLPWDDIITCNNDKKYSFLKDLKKGIYYDE